MLKQSKYKEIEYMENTGYSVSFWKFFHWDGVRRAQIRAELDAYYARLYALFRDELRFISDPKEVHGEDFPGETFRSKKYNNANNCR